MFNRKKLVLNSIDSAYQKQAEYKSDLYLKEVLTDEIVTSLKKSIEKLDDPAIIPAQVDKYRDSIQSEIDNWDCKSSLEFVDFYGKWTNNPEINKLKVVDSTQFKNLDIKMHFLLEVIGLESYKVSVALPGIITETSSPSTTGN